VRTLTCLANTASMSPAVGRQFPFVLDSTGNKINSGREMLEKRCPSCGERKPLDQFYRDSSKVDGFSSWCGSCQRSRRAGTRDTDRARMRAYYQEHKEDYRRRAASYRESKPIALFADSDPPRARRSLPGDLGEESDGAVAESNKQEPANSGNLIPSLDLDPTGSPEDRYRARFTTLHKRYGSALPLAVLDQLRAEYDADLRAVGRQPPRRGADRRELPASPLRPVRPRQPTSVGAAGKPKSPSRPTVGRTNVTVSTLAARLRTDPKRVSRHLGRLGFDTATPATELPANLDISELQTSLARPSWRRLLSRFRHESLPASARTLFDFVGRPVLVLDFETTGIDYRSGRVVEIGAIRLDVGGRTTFWAVVRPDGLEALPPRLPGTPLSTSRIAVGVPSGIAFEGLTELLADDPVVVGHNVSYDLGFLSAELERHNLPAWRGDFICTLYAAALLQRGVATDSGRGRVGSRWTDFVRYHYRLTDVCKALRIQHSTPHRALPDAKATEKVAMRLLSEAPAESVLNCVIGAQRGTKDFDYVPPGAESRTTPERRVPKRSPYRANRGRG
jgi:DNA polymerase III epsilon subunit-like protein